MNKKQTMPFERGCILDYLDMPTWSYAGFYLITVEEFLVGAHPKNPKLVDEVMQRQEFREWVAKKWIDKENKFISGNHNADTIRVDWVKKNEGNNKKQNINKKIQ